MDDFFSIGFGQKPKPQPGEDDDFFGIGGIDKPKKKPEKIIKKQAKPIIQKPKKKKPIFQIKSKSKKKSKKLDKKGKGEPKSYRPTKKEDKIRDISVPTTNLDSICEISGIKKKHMETLDNYNNSIITNDLFNKGKIELGSINNLIWSDVFDKLQALPNTIKTTNQRIENEKNTLQKINNELKEIEKRKVQLLEQTQEQENKIKLLQEVGEYWNTFKSDKLEGFIQVAENCRGIEKTLSTRLNEQLKKDVKGFTDLNDNSDKPNLSLVFNVVGLSPETILSLSEYDAESFIDFWEASNSTSLQEAKDILYCKEMLIEGIIPYTDHEEECPVCNCKNADELFELFEEYKIEISHDLLKKHQLNGRRMLGLSLNDVKHKLNLPKHQIIPFMRSLKKFKDLHKQHLK